MLEAVVQLFEAMGIERQHKETRTDWVLRDFRQFGGRWTMWPPSAVLAIPAPDFDQIVAISPMTAPLKGAKLSHF